MTVPSMIANQVYEIVKLNRLLLLAMDSTVYVSVELMSIL